MKSIRSPSIIVAAAACLLAVWSLSVHAQILTNGIYREVYTNIGGNTIPDLTNAIAFPNSPSITGVITNYFETPTFGDNYGQRLRALLVPPSTGIYTFWIASDDQSVLYLSTDPSPANKSVIASVKGWTGPRVWNQEANQVSGQIALAAGQRYYIEALHKQGCCGDNLAVRWSLPDGTLEEPIPALRLLPYGMLATILPTITAQPTNATVVEDSSAFFLVAVTNTDAVAYQWQRNSNNIAGATGAS